MSNILTYLSKIRHIAQLVDNGDGSFSELVAVKGNGSALFVSPGPGATPVIDLYQAVIAPAANTILFTANIPATGPYRVECELACGDTNPGHYTFLAYGPALRQAYCTGPGCLSVVWSRVQLTAGVSIDCRTGPLATAGSLYGATLRVYALP